ncbi:unnamed protein product [Phytomonas sp. EM1]|nr:unnamed protein product [Phytomonas sp. EM1]|eukprot:CCW60152.1 unnamed protein product [Phytomonas sp. isolate EM1]
MEFGTLPSTCGVDVFESEAEYGYMLMSTIIHVLCARSALRYWSAAMASSVALGVWRSRLSVWVRRWNDCTGFQKLRTTLWCAVFMACYVLQWAYYSTLPTATAASKGSLAGLHSTQKALQNGDMFMWYTSTVRAATNTIYGFILLMTCFQHFVGYPLLTRCLSKTGSTTHALEDTLIDPNSVEFDLACRYVGMFFTTVLAWLYSPREVPLVVQIILLISFFITLIRRGSLHAYQRILTRLQDTPASAEQACGICLDDFAESERVKQLPCGHVFHGRCARHWLHMHNDCPMCRQPVYTAMGLPLYSGSSPQRETTNPPVARRNVGHLSEESGIVGSAQPLSRRLPQYEPRVWVPTMPATEASNIHLSTASCPAGPPPNAPTILEDVVREVELRLSLATQRRQQVSQVYHTLCCETDALSDNHECGKESECDLHGGNDLFQDEPLRLRPLHHSPERKRARSAINHSIPSEEEPCELQRRRTGDTPN